MIRIDTGLYINVDNIVAIELQVPNTDLYKDNYKWAFYTNSPQEHVFFSKVFETKEEALEWFDETMGRFLVDRGGTYSP